ncbi:hypothetical protein BDZ85DRAFT_24648 [Elsinoe ampelina]|uniref:HTH La-type RNA-binding domain-containing protein n=1 Tax=Elsinoe ampelina TaxID=302913 RepID=A0A6A6G5T9_9PEZI|nr:hypothetical protein BDZ85DRAFT_24648 [Elsinoe ampelina]
MASYAAIAKGRSSSNPSTKPSSAGASGTTTPATTSIPELAPGTNWADDVESKDSAQTMSQASTDISSVPSSNTKQGDKTTPESDEKVQSSQTTTLEEKDATSNKDAPNEENGSTTKEIDTAASTEAGADDEKKDAEEVKPPKPVLQEAKIPTVNIWDKRAAELKAKVAAHVPTKPTPAPQTQSQPTTSEGDRGKFDGRRRSEQPFAGRDFKRGELPSRGRGDFKGGRGPREPRLDDTKRAPIKPRDRANSELLAPSTSSQASWPKPTDTVTNEEKKKSVEEKERVPSAGSKHGKPVWEHVPFTPTAVFETRIEGKPSARMGKGSGRPGPGGPRGPPQASPATEQRPGGRVPSLPNGDHKQAAQAGAPQADRDTMPPPPAKLQTDIESSQKTGAPQQQNGVSPSKETEVTPTEQSDLNGRAVPFTARRTSPKYAEHQNRRSIVQDTPNKQSAAPQTNGDSAKKSQSEHPQDLALSLPGPADAATNGEPFQTPRSTYSERRSEPHLYDSGREPGSFREGKRGGRKGGRGGYNNSFASPNPYAAGYAEFPPNQMPLSPTGGNFFPGGRGSHGGRGYRNQGPRSQSIPFDYGRPGGYPGYPMAPMQQPFMPDYYGPYSAGPYPVHPSSEKEMLIMTVLGQIEYYFSLDNLPKDVFLRKHMDSQGWIFLQVIAGFNRVKQMTTEYDILKQACLRSNEIEIRIGSDGKDRLRKVRDWERWVMPMDARDPAAQTEGPGELRRPSPVRNQFYDQPPFPQSPGSMTGGGRRDTFQIQDAAAAPTFFPGQMDPRFADFQPGPMEESRGRQVRPQHRDSTASPLTNGFGSAPQDGEADKFPSSQIEGLTVVVRKHEVSTRPALHNANSRTFSNGSIDSRSIMEEVTRSQAAAPMINGTGGSHSETPASPTSAQKSGEQANSDVDLYWVKDRADPVDSAQLPIGTTGELYTILRSKALAQRDAAATGTCPYDLDVLYQFWSHFLIRNFNSQMYHEFKNLASEDATQRHNDVGMTNLIKYYSEALASQIGVREHIVNDYAELLKNESSRSSRPAFKHLSGAWRDGSLNLKNRKKLGDALGETLKTELDS